MNDLGDAQLRRQTLLWLSLLAADTDAQLAWLDGRDVDTADVVEEGGLYCRISEELTRRGCFRPEDLRGLQALAARLAQLDDPARTGPWAAALATPAWDEVRQLARKALVTTLGDWHQPLPRRPAR
ncbi:hypothetical protein [Streptomyces indicus]|uniref:Uncharacterized protein n=1 Tax=Streptomyces indicus TaxID=417292 RepID=A0A1G8ZT36_9ACTN|nr:hypothetical protein [Streptomyces indicus]SDK18213.1 hypothetical protein SAMN05421806_105177 [Streptomyces indicus]